MFTIKHQSEDQVEYVPEFLNNRDLAEQWATDGGKRLFFWVELLPLSGADFQKASGQAFRRNRNDPDFMKGASRFVRRIIRQHVPEVCNLSFERPDGTAAQPTTGAELYDEVERGYPALGDLIDDIFNAIKDNSKASDGDLKKLKRRFGGSTPETTRSQPPETGGAHDAILTTSPSLASQTKTQAATFETATD